MPLAFRSSGPSVSAVGMLRAVKKKNGDPQVHHVYTVRAALHQLLVSACTHAWLRVHAWACVHVRVRVCMRGSAEETCDTAHTAHACTGQLCRHHAAKLAVQADHRVKHVPAHVAVLTANFHHPSTDMKPAPGHRHVARTRPQTCSPHRTTNM